MSVAVPVPALDLLTYRLPEAWPLPVPGARVDVPLGARRVTGIVVDAPVDPPAAPVRLRDIVAVRDTSAFVPPSLLVLTRWVAEYYHCETASPLPDGRLEVTLRAADPAWMRRLVLGLGPAAEVVGPAWLVEQVRAEATEALAAYA